MCPNEQDGDGERPAAVFIGASAGGIEAIAELLGCLPSGFAAPVLVTMHVPRAGANVLPMIFDRVGPLTAVSPADGEPLVDGVVYVAPRGRHMLVEDAHVRLSDGPLEHGLRPAIDPMFRSGARVFGPRCVGVVLSGLLDDGTAGLREIKDAGGWAFAQDLEEAAFAAMPGSAIAGVDVDAVLPVAGIAQRLDELTRGGAHPQRILAAGRADGAEPVLAGMRTDITCPLCGSLLSEQVDGRLTTYHCELGHLFSVESLIAVQGEGIDTALWRPIRMLRERAALLRRLQKRAEAQGRSRSIEFFRKGADDAAAQAAEMQRTVSELVAARADDARDAKVDR